MGVEGGENAACGGARAFFDAAGQQGGFRACGRELLSFRVERKQPKNAT